MISRFFKKKPKATEPQEATTEKPSQQESINKETPLKPKKLLTAAGWKRMMMGKIGKKK